jgi:hypothetical protein
VVLLPLYTPSPWHCWQGTAPCAPVSGNAVREWSNDIQVTVVWHTMQSVVNPALT